MKKSKVKCFWCGTENDASFIHVRHFVMYWFKDLCYNCFDKYTDYEIKENKIFKDKNPFPDYIPKQQWRRFYEQSIQSKSKKKS